jgi:hypothetical protein
VAREPDSGHAFPVPNDATGGPAGKPQRRERTRATKTAPECEQAHTSARKIRFSMHGWPCAQTRGVWRMGPLVMTSRDGQKEEAPMSDHSHKCQENKLDTQSDVSSKSKRTAPSHFPSNSSTHHPHSVVAPREPVSSGAGPGHVPAYYSVAAPHGPMSSSAGSDNVPAYYSVAAPHGPMSSSAGPDNVPAYYSVAAPHRPVSSGAGPDNVPAYYSVAAPHGPMSSGPRAANIT